MIDDEVGLGPVLWLYVGVLLERLSAPSVSTSKVFSPFASVRSFLAASSIACDKRCIKIGTNLIELSDQSGRPPQSTSGPGGRLPRDRELRMLAKFVHLGNESLRNVAVRVRRNVFREAD